MLNEFLTKKNQMGTVLRNVEEMTKLKRYVTNLLSYFQFSSICRESLTNLIKPEGL